jgi:hypothetical protein
MIKVVFKVEAHFSFICPGVATGYNAYKCAIQMIKVVFKVKLISPSYVWTWSDIKRTPNELPQIQPPGQSGLPQI